MNERIEAQNVLTKREYMAAHLCSGIIASITNAYEINFTGVNTIAAMAVRFADALLWALNNHEKRIDK